MNKCICFFVITARTQLVAKGPISNLQDGWNNLELIVEVMFYAA